MGPWSVLIVEILITESFSSGEIKLIINIKHQMGETGPIQKPSLADFNWEVQAGCISGNLSLRTHYDLLVSLTEINHF